MISEENKYNFYVGTSRGAIIVTKGDPKEKLVYAKTEEPSEITSLSFGRADEELICGYESGETRLYNSLTNKYTKTISNTEGDGRVCGLGVVNKTIIIGKHDGVINLWNGKKNDFFSINLDEKSTMETLVQNSNREGVVGLGGEFNDFKLWNIETKQQIFKAKSMGHDELNLAIPTSVRGICFFSESEYLSACATKEGHVLMYDDRAQRRPVVKFFEQKASFTCISTAHRERQCLVGTTKGYMMLLDMKAGKTMKTFMSFSGGVTGIQCDPIEPIVVSSSLDRHLRIHNLETKQLIEKVYLKQNLTKILMKPIVKNEPDDKDTDKEKVGDEEFDAMFNNMDTVTDEEPKKEKRKLIESSDVSKKKKKKKVVKP